MYFKFREDLDVLLDKFGIVQVKKKKFKELDAGYRIPETVTQQPDVDAIQTKAEWTGFKFHMFRLLLIVV